MGAGRKRLYEVICLSSYISFTPLNPKIANQKKEEIKKEETKKPVYIEKVNCDFICTIIS